MNRPDDPPKAAGSHRLRSPASTWAWLAPQLPRFGITRVANVTGLDALGVPVCVAVRPQSRGLSVSQGKGLCLDQARVSAAMESIECWHAERCGGAVYAGTADQAREDGLALASLEGFARRPTRLPLNATPLQFVEAVEVRSGEPVWLPLDCISTDFVIDQDHPPVFMRSSNGLAAGNSTTEALCQALAEVAERDALQRWFASGGFMRPASRLQSAPCERLAGLLERCAGIGVRVLVWSLEGFSAVPAYAVLLAAEQGSRQRRDVGLFSGYGCHRCPQQALRAALLEAVQSRLTLITGSRDDMPPAAYAQCRDGAFVDRLLALHANAASLEWPPAAASSRLQDDLAWLLDALAARYRMPIYAKDLTRPEIGIPVVKVVIPGLLNLGAEHRHFVQAVARVA
jgi:YcaO-like protein with predicted kinase domain